MLTDKINLPGVPGSYLDGGWFDEADSFNVLHDLWITLKGLQKGATGVGKRTFLSLLLQVVHKDAVIFLPVEKHKKDIVELVKRVN